MKRTAFPHPVNAGFNRMSIGIQDIRHERAEACNRLPTLLPIEEIFALLAKTTYASIWTSSTDCPANAGKFFLSIQKAIDLSPDRLVTFSYATCPVCFSPTVFRKEGLRRRNKKTTSITPHVNCSLLQVMFKWDSTISYARTTKLCRAALT
jgi:oxygen-independent coproporphyrinogen-3 oxidase